MSATPIEETDATKGSRSWLEDDRNTTEQAEAAHWDTVKKGSDELLDYYWNNYGKWGAYSRNRHLEPSEQDCGLQETENQF